MILAYSCMIININGMLPELFLDMFTPISDIHNYDTRQVITQNLFVSTKSTSRGQQSITYIGPHVWIFMLSKINPHCSIGSFKRHIRQLLWHCSVSDLTWWSLILKQQNVLLTLTPHVFIYIYILIDPYVIYISICTCVIFILFNWFRHLCPRQTWSLAFWQTVLYQKCYTVTCFFAPCFDNYLLWNKD